ncbi:MAG: hypothetical protein AAGH65_07675 [Pseudomonadota bacterium]
MTEHKKFDWGISDDQIKTAERILDDLELDAFVERRNAPDEYFSGTIKLPESDEKITVMVTRAFEDRPFQRAVVSIDPIPKIWFAELSFEREQGTVTMTGRVEASRPGKRDSDRLQKQRLNVSVFHQDRE